MPEVSNSAIKRSNASLSKPAADRNYTTVYWLTQSVSRIWSGLQKNFAKIDPRYKTGSIQVDWKLFSIRCWYLIELLLNKQASALTLGLAYSKHERHVSDRKLLIMILSWILNNLVYLYLYRTVEHKIKGYMNEPRPCKELIAVGTRDWDILKVAKDLENKSASLGFSLWRHILITDTASFATKYLVSVCDALQKRW